MEEEETNIIIHSGSGNKSIGTYVDKICQELINNLNVSFKSFDKNMNKLITVEQIIRRALDNNNEKDKNDSKINYEIGKEGKIPYIKCTININKDDLKNLEKLIGNKSNKRNRHPFSEIVKTENIDTDCEINSKNKKKKVINNNEKEEEDKINDFCIQNIHDFFSGIE